MSHYHPRQAQQRGPPLREPHPRPLGGPSAPTGAAVAGAFPLAVDKLLRLAYRTSPDSLLNGHNAHHEVLSSASCGLLQPVYWWTHRALDEGTVRRQSMQMLATVLRHFHTNGVPDGDVGVLLLPDPVSPSSLYSFLHGLSSTITSSQSHVSSVPAASNNGGAPNRSPPPPPLSAAKLKPASPPSAQELYRSVFADILSADGDAVRIRRDDVDRFDVQHSDAGVVIIDPTTAASPVPPSLPPAAASGASTDAALSIKSWQPRCVVVVLSALPPHLAPGTATVPLPRIHTTMAEHLAHVARFLDTFLQTNRLSTVVFISHSWWTQPPREDGSTSAVDAPLAAQCEPLRAAVAKLHTVRYSSLFGNEDPHSSSPTDGEQRHAIPLVGHRIPMCCSVHRVPSRLYLAVDDAAQSSFIAPLAVALAPQVASVAATFCKMPCNERFTCGVPAHRCPLPCHRGGDPAALHASCTHPCVRRLPCGHPCLAACGEQCDCGQIAEMSLACGHYRTVPGRVGTTEVVTHVVKTTCVAAARAREQPGVWNESKLILPTCDVAVPTRCMHCEGDAVVPCHVVQAALIVARRESSTPAAGPVTMDELRSIAAVSCDTCTAKLRSLRSETRLELIRQAEMEKEQRLRDIRAQLYEIEKAAKSGVYSEGQRVAIVNCGAVRGAMPDLFSQVTSATGGWFDGPAEDLLEEGGRIVARQVDFADTSEVLYLVSLNRGSHVVVADAGLELTKAILSAEGSKIGSGTAGSWDPFRGATGSAAASGPLLLTGPKPTEAPSNASKAAMLETLKAQFPIGSTALLVHPVPLGSDVAPLDLPEAPPSEWISDPRTLYRRIPRLQYNGDDDRYGISSVVAEVCGYNELPVGDDAQPHHAVEIFITLVTQLTEGDVTTSDSSGDDAGADCLPVGDEDQPSGVDPNPSSCDDGMGEELDRRRKFQRTQAASSFPHVGAPPTQESGRYWKLRFRLISPPSHLERIMFAPGAAVTVREPVRHIYGLTERRAFATAYPTAVDVANFVPVPLNGGEVCTVVALLNAPRMLAEKDRGPCVLVTPKRGRNAGRVALVPLNYCELDHEALAENTLTSALLEKLEVLVAQRFQAYCDDAVISNLEAAALRERRDALLARSGRAAPPWSIATVPEFPSVSEVSRAALLSRHEKRQKGIVAPIRASPPPTAGQSTAADSVRVMLDRDAVRAVKVFKDEASNDANVIVAIAGELARREAAVAAQQPRTVPPWAAHLPPHLRQSR